MRYVDSVRMHGHRAAKIDPLDLLERDEVAALDPSRYGLKDPNKEYPLDGILWNKVLPGSDSKSNPTSWKLKDIAEFLKGVYVGKIGYEFMHSPSKSERLWFSNLLESSQSSAQLTNEEKKRIWSLLAKSETFDHFLQAKLPNLKRYGEYNGDRVERLVLTKILTLQVWKEQSQCYRR
jgi:probable 2-oxoglutarate dehydrogenase E1 component DHKTD1